MPIELSLHKFRRLILGLLIFFNLGFLSIFLPSTSISRLSTTPHFSLLYTTSLFAFCFVFPIPLYAVHQHLPSHMPVRKTTPDKTHNLQWQMFHVIHVAPQPLGAGPLPSPYLSHVLFAQLFNTRYYGRRGRRSFLRNYLILRTAGPPIGGSARFLHVEISQKRDFQSHRSRRVCPSCFVETMTENRPRVCVLFHASLI